MEPMGEGLSRSLHVEMGVRPDMDPVSKGNPFRVYGFGVQGLGVRA